MVLQEDLLTLKIVRQQILGVAYGIVVKKKIGNAVMRNTIKRRVRAAVRDIAKHHGVHSASYIVIIKKREDYPFQMLYQCLKRGMVRDHTP